MTHPEIAMMLDAQQRARLAREARLKKEFEEELAATAEAEDLLFTQLQAKGKELGHAIYRVSTGGYVAQRRSHSRHFSEIDSLSHFIKQAGG